eukprot:TRINITY_DN15349_c0_g1::TRINITY_DN15349_c0_g1_i1::g.22781::m.22781 TRINITY_DN15349_c0_g1::TRINITY_DN15349_c0_g1_i1::g.22781  ORF type:complete len:560 (-),score=136.10,sp/O60308/CE104_HUMAN/23.40/8e-12,HEAT/PF02985.17/2e+02,HEAT/PF02985.17/94,HEAT/PF02985.17/0.42,HEAT/PF02985.17/1.3e+03,CLASP_N/PF12348.3/0.0011,HEAT_2/PF13646.1/1.6,HEAT_2/PF13646.1/1.2e+03 TRINITY_DN15349_c0_g1_i1:171-1850(-)
MPGLFSNIWSKFRNSFRGKTEKEKEEKEKRGKIHSAPPKLDGRGSPDHIVVQHADLRPHSSPLTDVKTMPDTKNDDKTDKSLKKTKIDKKKEDGTKVKAGTEPAAEVDEALTNALVEIFGGQDVSRLFSETWDVRDEAMKVIRDQLTEERIRCNDEEKVFQVTSMLLQRMLADRVAPVYFTSLDALKALMKNYTAEVQKCHLIDSCSNLIPILVSRIGDSNARVHEASCHALIFMARLRTVGPEAVFPHCVIPFTNQKKTRHIRGRLLLLRRAIPEFTFADSGMSCERVMALPRPALAIPDDKVRKAAMNVAVEAYKLNPKVTKRSLRELNPALLKTMQARFDEVDGLHSSSSGEHSLADDTLAAAAPSGSANERIYSDAPSTSSAKPPRLPVTNQASPSNKRKPIKRALPPLGKRQVRATETGEIVSRPTDGSSTESAVDDPVEAIRISNTNTNTPTKPKAKSQSHNSSNSSTSNARASQKQKQLQMQMQMQNDSDMHVHDDDDDGMLDDILGATASSFAGSTSRSSFQDYDSPRRVSAHPRPANPNPAEDDYDWDLS